MGRRLHVRITRINESNNDLILSEKEAWVRFDLSVLAFICIISWSENRWPADFGTECYRQCYISAREHF